MDSIDEYRKQIREELARALDAKGNPRLTEGQVKRLLEQLSDGELADGMPFNTPEEVAQLLLESGLQ